MTKIDPATGLPELPEGYFWNIEENSIEIRGKLPPGEWKGSWAANLYEKYPETYELRTSHREVTSGRWPFKITRNQEEEQYREINRSRELKTERYGTWEYLGEWFGTTCIKRDPVTKENIVERCTKVLEDWNEETERQKLYGHYPPKRLEH